MKPAPQRALATSPLMAPLVRWLLQRSREGMARAGFAADFVEGQPGAFTYGLDMRQCGIRALFAEEGAAAFARQLCRIDFLFSGANGLELVRTGTLAAGASRCDFRFRRP
jgi:hypothetical protein